MYGYNPKIKVDIMNNDLEEEPLAVKNQATQILIKQNELNKC